MANQIDRPGTFRGTLIEWGVSETKNGFPQFVAKLKADEYYDETTGEWVAWGEFDQEITAFLVLYSLDQKTGQWTELLNAKQLQKALAWDGQDFQVLAEGDYAKTRVLVRVEEHEYNNVTKLQVSWIDTADADPVRKLQKFDTEKLKGLNAKFAGVINKPAAPAKAPAKAPVATPPKKAVKKATAATPPTSPSSAPVAPAAPPTAEAATPPETPAPPAAGKIEAPLVATTKAEAWNAICTNPLKAEGVTDAKIAEIWVVEVTKIGKAEDQITGLEWAAVQKAVVDQTSTF
jgi:hypothetical protein